MTQFNGFLVEFLLYVEVQQYLRDFCLILITRLLSTVKKHTYWKIYITDYCKYPGCSCNKI